MSCQPICAEIRPSLFPTPEPISLSEMLATLREGQGRSPGLIPIPPMALKAMVVAAGRQSLWDRIGRELVASSAKLQQAGWSPQIDTKAGLSAMVKATARRFSEQLKMKRMLDFAGLRLFLLMFWPILLIIVVAIRLQSPGSAIFAQVRVGKDGRPFTCYKLRTMYTGTANVPTHQVEASSVTALGEYLRRFKIDELPQLCNVLLAT